MKPFLPREMREPPRLPSRLDHPPATPKHVLLLIPFYPKDPYGSFGKHVLTPSQALTSIAAATPSDWSVSYWDENLLQGPPPVSPMPQVVGITVHLTFARRTYELAAWYRERGAIVVLGGPHVTACEEEAAPHANAVVHGEGAQVWPRLLRDVEQSTLKTAYRGSYKRPFRKSPLPRRSVLPRALFLTTSSLIATRGCHNRCDFCFLSTSGMLTPYQRRDVADVVEDFASDDQPYGVFTDNNLGSDRQYLRELCEGLRPLDKIWSAAVSLDVTDDVSLVREMALAGCTGVFVGFESLWHENLRDVGKRCSDPADYGRRVRIFRNHGIQVNGSFVFGFDHDTEDVFNRTVDWIEQHRLECATFHILTPYPGTPLFDRLEYEGRILHRNWDLYDTAHAVFRPARMSCEKLEEGYAWCYQRLFSHASIWRRRPEDIRSVAPYLAMSYLYKKSNFLWRFLIRHRLTAAVWRPLVEVTRRRHLRCRKKLAASMGANTVGVGNVVSAGV